MHLFLKLRCAPCHSWGDAERSQVDVRTRKVVRQGSTPGDNVSFRMGFDGEKGMYAMSHGTGLRCASFIYGAATGPGESWKWSTAVLPQELVSAQAAVRLCNRCVGDCGTA